MDVCNHRTIEKIMRFIKPNSVIEPEDYQCYGTGKTKMDSKDTFHYVLCRINITFYQLISKNVTHLKIMYIEHPLPKLLYLHLKPYKNLKQLRLQFITDDSIENKPYFDICFNKVTFKNLEKLVLNDIKLNKIDFNEDSFPKLVYLELMNIKATDGSTIYLNFPTTLKYNY